MTPAAAIEALGALHVQGSYRTYTQWDGDASTRTHPCCMVCDKAQGWPCQTRAILDTAFSSSQPAAPPGDAEYGPAPRKPRSSLAPGKPTLADIRGLVDEQAEDEALWAIYPLGQQPVAEAYLQQELRRLHALIEAATEGVLG